MGDEESASNWATVQLIDPLGENLVVVNNVLNVDGIIKSEHHELRSLRLAETIWSLLGKTSAVGRFAVVFGAAFGSRAKG